MKCKECGQHLHEGWRLLLKGKSSDRTSCRNCGEEHMVNGINVILILAVGGFISVLITIVLPGLSWYFVYPVTVSCTFMLISEVNGLKKVNQTIKTNPLKWYTSPLVVIVPIMSVLFYFMFR